jgi:hypothetical protein
MLFAPTIHMAMLKTAAGVFDMEPHHFYADAAAHGFRKPPRDFGLYIFDSFKRFDGKLYVALNNFIGKQNALALVHDDLATYSGSVVTWDEAVAKGPDEMPRSLAWDADPPVLPDADGSYEHAVAIPGVYRAY